MIDNNFIIPECYIDTCLIEVLLKAGKNLANHQKGNGTVAKKMKGFAEVFCIGIIDEDRKTLDYLKEFQLKIASDNLKLWKHDTLHHYVIQLCPVIERWIMNDCLNRGITLQDLNLPTDLKKFTKITKSISSRNDNRLIRLFKTMLKEECESLLRLKNWIEYLKQHKYNSDINELVNA